MTPETPLARAGATAERRSTSLKRLFTVFTSPGATFAELARDPHFILCWCVQVVVAEIFGIVLVRRIGVVAMARQALAQNPATQLMAPDKFQHALAVTAMAMKISFFAAPVWTVVIMLVLAAILLGLGNFVLGYEARYKQSVAMVSYAYLTLTLFTILAIVVVVTSADPTSLQFANLVGTNIGFFLDKNATSRFVYALATRVDIFAIWAVILLGIGLAKMGGKKGKAASAIATVAALWVLYILVVSGLASLG